MKLRLTAGIVTVFAGVLQSCLFSAAAAPSVGYTGSLLSPAGALYKEGGYNFEPYFISILGRCSSGQPTTAKNECVKSLESHILLKYAITKYLSVRTVFAQTLELNRDGARAQWGVNDLPVEGIWRLYTGRDNSIIPDVNLFGGVSLPIGRVNNLPKGISSFGDGQYEVRTGLTFQRAFTGRRPFRLRPWIAVRFPQGTSRLQGGAGGRANKFTEQTGPYGEAGIGGELNLTKRIVLVADLAGYMNSEGIMRLRTTNSSSKIVATHYIAVAPAIEYNISHQVGVICGAVFSMATSNINQFISGECAINVSL